MKTISYIVLALSLTILGSCSLEQATSPGPPLDQENPTDKSRGRPGMPMGQYLHANKEALGRQTFQSAYKLERAVWRYAAENDGEFPVTPYAPNKLGKSAIDYLPGGQQLWNAFTGVRTNPVDNAAAVSGEVGYVSIFDGQGYLVGYSITAMGIDYPYQFLELEYYPPRMNGD